MSSAYEGKESGGLMPTLPESLQRTIATLEAQRSALGDEAVDLALAPIRSRLAELGGEAQRRVAGRVGAPERKVVTVMFVDVSGFTALSETLDAEVVRELMNSCFDSLVPVIERYGGVIDKFIGDEIMALFGAPQATEHHADHALRACLDCFFAIGDFNDRNDTALSLHIGVNSGLVVAGGVGSTGHQDYSVMGDAVNVAARLEGASETGEILVGPATFRLTADSFEFEPLAPIALKGKTQPMPVYRLLGPKLHRASSAEARERLSLSHVGRDGELRTLLERAQNVTDRSARGTGNGNVVAITGDAGIGKSRMLSEFHRHLGAAMSWLEVGAQSHRSEFSHALVQDLIDALLGVSGTGDKDKKASLLETHVHECLGARGPRLLPYLFAFCDLPLGSESGTQLAALSPEALRRRMWDAVHELIAASFHDPTVLVFEDLHWADPSSIALLREIVARHSAPLMIVFTSRPDAKRTEGWLRELADIGDSVLHLERLDKREVRGLIDAVLTTHDEQSNLPERLTERADGNPFYLVSFLRSLVDDGRGTLHDGRIEVLGSVDDLHIPDSLHAVVAARIDRLADDSKHYLRLASILGRNFARALLTQLAEAESPALDTGLVLADLMDRQLIERQSGGTAQFVHAVVHEVAYEGMLASERRRLHRLTARLLTIETDDESERSLATLAWHHEHAADQREASSLYERAAAVALRSHANDEALSYFASAIRLADAGDMDRTMLLRERNADLRHRAGQYDTAQSDYRTLLDDLDDDRIETRCRLFRKQARCLLPQHRYGEATENLAEARIALQGREARVRDGSWWHEHFELSLDSMWQLYLVGDPTEFATTVSEMSADFGSYASATQRGRLDRIRALLELRQHRFRVGPPTVARANEAVEQLSTSGDESELCFAMFTHAFTLLWSGEHARAEDGFHAALLVAERIGDAERTLMSLTYLALAARFRNDSATAEAFALAARSAAGKSPIYSGVAIANLGWVAWRNREQQAAELCESAQRLLVPFPTYPFQWINALVGLALVLERTPPDLATAAELATAMMSPLQQLLHPDLQEALAAAVEQPPETALDAFRTVVASARSTGYL